MEGCILRDSTYMEYRNREAKSGTTVGCQELGRRENEELLRFHVMYTISVMQNEQVLDLSAHHDAYR